MREFKSTAHAAHFDRGIRRPWSLRSVKAYKKTNELKIDRHRFSGHHARDSDIERVLALWYTNDYSKLGLAHDAAFK